MITVEDLLMAYASAYDAWLDPEAERKNPTPEYAELIRQVVSFENEKLQELVEDMLDCIEIRAAFNRPPTTDMYEQFAKRASELGIEVDE